MRLFKKKDKNQLQDHSISDVLISYTLNSIGKSKEDVLRLLDNIEFAEKKSDDEKNLSLLALLDNNCVLNISFENGTAFKVNIWLNQKVAKSDVKNLELFAIMHEDDYYFYNLKDNELNRYMIAFESKIY